MTALQSELDITKTAIREQTVAKDRKINELVEELGNTQALLSAKTAEYEMVCHSFPNHSFHSAAATYTYLNLISIYRPLNSGTLFIVCTVARKQDCPPSFMS